MECTGKEIAGKMSFRVGLKHANGWMCPVWFQGKTRADAERLAQIAYPKFEIVRGAA